MSIMWSAVIVLLVTWGGVVSQNCRGEEPRLRDCENLCDGKKCAIRAALLLPANSSYDASLSIVSY